MPIARPAGVECPKWEPAVLGGKRCRYYIDPRPAESGGQGLCQLPDEFVCVEWSRRFGSEEQRAALALRPYPAGSRPVAPADPDAPAPLALAVQDRPPPRLTLVRSPGPPMPRGEPLVARGESFTPAKEVDPRGLEALEQAGAEVDLLAPHLERTVTLVPSRTGRTDRYELTFREAAVLRMVVDCFPGAHVVGYRRFTPAEEAGISEAQYVAETAVGLPKEAYEYPPGTPLGTVCSVCREPQTASRGGATCPNGHGGAPSLEGVDPYS
jgi:hypothetical protein